MANSGGGTVSVIDTATNSIVATIDVGQLTPGIAVSPDGTRVYVSSSIKNNVSVINTTTNTVVATVAVGKIAQQNAMLSLKSAHHSPAHHSMLTCEPDKAATGFPSANGV